MSERVEEMILGGLIGNDEYARKTLPFIDPLYFSSRVEKTLFSAVKAYFDKYNKSPSVKALKILVEDKNFNQAEYDRAIQILDEVTTPEQDLNWLIDRTEKFCQEQSLYNAITTSISIMNGDNDKLDKGAIPSLLQEALAVSFDKTVGHDYMNDAEKRYDFYHLKQDRIRFGMEIFNKITKGGLPKKTLSCILAPTGVGKSLALCDLSSSCIRNGQNVLYITMELAEERVAERIDCNLLNVTLDELQKLKKDEFTSRITSLQSKHHGKLVIKEYPTGGAHVGHFRNLLDELHLKKKFKPDIIMVDYINICASQKYKSSNYNSYFAVKAMAEELRGLAVEYDVPIFTATQAAKSGLNNTDIDMDSTSESMGLVHTLDFYFALIRTEELDQMGQIMVKQLKSRFADINQMKRFVIGSDFPHFRLFDIDQPTKNVMDDSPITKQPQKKKLDFDGLDFE